MTAPRSRAAPSPNPKEMMRPHRTRRAVFAAAVTSLSCALVLAPLTASAAIVDNPAEHSAASAALARTPLGSYESGVFDESAAEIVQAHGTRLFVVNANAGAVDVLDYSDPAAITKLFSITAAGTANSVAIRADGLGVIAFEAPVKTDPGTLVFFDANASDAGVLGSVTVGALPDMVAISADGAYAVSANEGEPSDDFSIDPEDVRVFGPTPHGADNPVSRNLEPEYIAIDGGTAYAALQEANAVAVVDLTPATVTDVWPLGFKDHSVAGDLGAEAWRSFRHPIPPPASRCSPSPTRSRARSRSTL